MTLQLAGRTPAKFEYTEGKFQCSWVFTQDASEEEILDMMGSVLAFMSTRGTEVPFVETAPQTAPQAVLEPVQGEPLAVELITDEPAVPGIPWDQFMANPVEMGEEGAA